jgi:hypothetical protein
MGGLWTLDRALSGRELRHARLGPGERLAMPPGRAVVSLLSGSATLGGAPLGERVVAVAPGATIEAGPDGCIAGAIRWGGAPPAGAVEVASTDARYFEKYESFQAQLRVRVGGEDLLAPWELYHVRMVAEPRRVVHLHVHRVVTNVLLVRGPAGAERGYLVVERDGHVEATPLVGGDRAMVPTGLHHTVVPLEVRDPIEMVVFNDDVSAYEDVGESDFHIVAEVPWSEVRVVPRADPRPRFTIVE